MTRSTIPFCDGNISPVHGCERISPGCLHCYAWTWAKRFRQGDMAFRFDADKLHDIERVKSGLYFLGHMTDLFHATPLSRGWTKQVMDATRATMARFLTLTKRAENMATFRTSGYWSNVACGVTAENQEMWDKRVPILQSIPAPMRFVSVEPMLGPVTLSGLAHNGHGISWLFAGPETGGGARPCDPTWITDLAAECVDRHVAFFDKRDPATPGFTRREWAAGWEMNYEETRKTTA